jgi:ketosteroid isomerase-like protein
MHAAGALIVALVITCVDPPSATVSAERNDAAERDIKVLELKLAGLLVARDFDEYEKHLAADYTRINPAGVVETREQVMAGFRASAPGTSMDPTELDVKVYGDTAILTGKLATTSSAETRHSRFRKVFIRREGQWFLVSLQGITLAEQQ